MENDVFLINYSLRLPFCKDIGDLLNTIKDKPEFKITKVDDKQTIEFGDIEFSPDTKYYPDRHDIKVMRKDVLATTICAAELIEKSALQNCSVEDIPLYISSGVFIENSFFQDKRSQNNLKNIFSLEDESEMKRKFFKLVPPLIALNTLTNAASSYASQYSKIAGRNSTYGITSLGGSQSLESAFQEIASGRSHLAVAGASNTGGKYSFVTFNQFFEQKDHWRESCGAIILLLASASYLTENKVQALCKIDEISFSKNAPSLLGKNTFENAALEVGVNLPLVYSGAFTRQAHNAQQNLYRKQSNARYSLFETFGNIGPVNNLINILFASTLFSTQTKRVNCLDKDPYGREALIQISSSSLNNAK